MRKLNLQPSKQSLWLTIILLFLMPYFLNSCISENTVSSIPAESTSPTAQASPTVTPTPIIYHTVTPKPTATLEEYTIQSNDTIIGIGKKLDLTPEAILQVNPGLNPSALIPGASVFLPSTDPNTLTYSLTPVPLIISDPICLPQADQLRCVVNVSNPADLVAENISVEIYLIGTDGSLIERRTAPILLNSLYPGESLPAIASFPLTENYNSVQAALSSATYNEDTIYERQNSFISSTSSIQWNGRSATIDGIVTKQTNKQVWIAALGFDAIGNLCAARRYESTGVDQFSLELVSYAGSIDSVQIVVETWK